MASTQQRQEAARQARRAAKQATKPKSPKMVLIVYPDGSLKDVAGDLCDDFDFFCSLKDGHDIDTFDYVPGSEGQALIDDDGLLKGSTFNPIASRAFGYKLVGPVFIQQTRLMAPFIARIKGA